MINKNLNIFKFLNDNYKIFNNIEKINSSKFNFIFYSENKTYLKYSYLIIKSLSEKYPGQVCYVSSDHNDKIENLNVENFYIGNGFLRNFFFKSVATKNMFLTTTDLGNNEIKKNRNVLNYIYYFHSPVSTFKQYSSGAFDNYDIILCNGKYQEDEIRKDEILNNKKNKKFFNTGYFYFDYLKDRVNLNNNTNEILIAPSWNINDENFINKNFELIIAKILSNGFSVRFRPHPENLKRSSEIINSFKEKFKDKKFILDISSDNKEALENAACLITDNSGIAIEYLLIFKKPVLYFNDKEKIHNSNYKKFMIKSLEDEIKEKFGIEFNINDLHKINHLIDHSVSLFKNKSNKIDRFLNLKFYNFGSTEKSLNNFF